MKKLQTVFCATVLLLAVTTSVYSQEEDRDYYIEYVAVYTARPCLPNGPYLPRTEDDAFRFMQWINAAPHWELEGFHHNGSAVERHWHQDEEIEIAEADFAYFSGLGYPGEFWFSDVDGGCRVEAEEIVFEWGNNDLEWIAISAGRTLKQHHGEMDFWLRWFISFDSLHLLCGLQTHKRDYAIGDFFGERASGWRCKIAQSWLSATRNAWWNPGHMSPVVPWVYPPVVIAPSAMDFDDHLHGLGTVEPDVPGGAWYHTLTLQGEDTPITKMPPREYAFDRSGAKSIAYPERNHYAVLAPAEMLSCPTARDMTQLEVISGPVTADDVLALAQSFCDYDSILCGVKLGDIEYDTASGVYSAVEDPHQLHVYEVTGAFEYIQTETYATPTDSAPSLPLESSVQSLTDAFLSTIGYLKGDAEPDSVFWLRLSMFDTTTGAEVEDSSWSLGVGTGRHRVHDATYPVIGPGAILDATFGEEGELQNAYCGGWRDLAEGPSVATISALEALTDLAYCGGEIAIGGMPPWDEFLVTGGELGYFEAGPDESISELEIVWIINGYCVFNHPDEGYDTSDYQIIIPARYRHPRAEILSPATDTTIIEGGTIILSGDASSGSSPYEYYWSSDIDGDLGSGGTLQVSSLSLVANDATPHTIILQVVDANEMRDFAAVRVTVQPAYLCGDADGNDIVNISDAVYLIAYIFGGGPPPDPLLAGDVDCNEIVNISDAVYLIAYIFGGGPEPCAQCPQPGQVSGALVILVRDRDFLDDTRVAVYVSLEDWENNAPTAFALAVQTGPTTAIYSISNVPTGTYYLDAWKDVDENGVWSSGDIVGWYGSGVYPNPTLDSFQLDQNENELIIVENAIVVP